MIAFSSIMYCVYLLSKPKMKNKHANSPNTCLCVYSMWKRILPLILSPHSTYYAQVYLVTRNRPGLHGTYWCKQATSSLRVEVATMRTTLYYFCEAKTFIYLICSFLLLKVAIRHGFQRIPQLFASLDPLAYRCLLKLHGPNYTFSADKMRLRNRMSRKC